MVIDARSYERQRGQERAGGAYARTYVRTYVKRTFVRMYVLFRLRTYARNGLRCGLCFTYVRTRTCVRTYCFTCHVRTHVRTYCFTCHRALRTVSLATYVRTYVLFHLPRTYVRIVSLATYVRTVSIATYVGLALPRCSSRCGKGVAKMLFTYVGLALPRCSDNCGKGGALGRSVRAGFGQSPLRRRGRQ